MGIFDWLRVRTGRESAPDDQEPAVENVPVIDEAAVARTRQTELDQALHQAIRSRDVEQCKQLLDDGADTNARDQKRVTALDRTLELAEPAALERCEEFDTDSEMQARHERNAARCERSVEIGLLLIDKGAELQHRNFLQSAGIYNDDPRLCQAMIDKGMDVNHSDSGRTALHCVEDNVRIARTLLEAGADPNAAVVDQLEDYSTTAMAWIDTSGSTPLHNAVLAGHSEVVEALLEFGADVDLEAACFGGSTLDMAKPDPEMAARLQSWKDQRQLEANTAQVSDTFARDTAAVLADNFNPMAPSSANAVASDAEPQQRRQRLRL